MSEGTQAATTPKETSTQDQSWGREDVSADRVNWRMMVARMGLQVRSSRLMWNRETRRMTLTTPTNAPRINEAARPNFLVFVVFKRRIIGRGRNSTKTMATVLVIPAEK